MGVHRWKTLSHHSLGSTEVHVNAASEGPEDAAAVCTTDQLTTYALTFPPWLSSVAPAWLCFSIWTHPAPRWLWPPDSPASASSKLRLQHSPPYLALPPHFHIPARHLCFSGCHTNCLCCDFSRKPITDLPKLNPWWNCIQKWVYKYLNKNV